MDDILHSEYFFFFYVIISKRFHVIDIVTNQTLYLDKG